MRRAMVSAWARPVGVSSSSARPRKRAGLMPSTWPWRVSRRRVILPILSGGAFAGRLLPGLAFGLLRRQEPLGLVARGAATLEAAAQRFHQIDDLLVLFLRRGGLDRLALLLALDQGAQRIFVAVLEAAGIELGLLLGDDLLGDLQHLRLGPGQVLVEHRAAAADLVVRPQGGEQDAVVARLERAGPLALVHHQPAQRHLVLLLHG